MEKDEKKVHPPAPVILQMEDDDGTEDSEADKKPKGFGARLPFGKKHEKNSEIKKTQKDEVKSEQEADFAAEKNTSNAVMEEGLSTTEDVSTYIESVMKSVENIEATVAEELQNTSGDKASEEKGYQSKLHEVEEDLSPKERLEQLMRLIEEERREEQKEQAVQEPTVDEELDLDEFLTNLVGSNSITQAMVKTYRDEKQTEELQVEQEEDR